jgi:hypothetical protein
MKDSIAWWFKKGGASFLTIPVFLLLAVGTVGAFIQGGIQTIAYVKVTKAVWGWFGLGAYFFLWPFSLLTAGLMFWSAIAAPPAVLKEDEPTPKITSFFITLFLVVLFVVSGEFVSWINGKAIGWIADRNPDAAYSAGVTGSIPPSGSKK